MQLPGLNPLGTMAATVSDPPTRKTQHVERIAESDGAQGAATQGREHPEQASNVAKVRDIKALREAIGQKTLPAGPPPAFEMNLLEAQSGVDPALARFEASRGQARDAAFVRPAEDSAQDLPTVTTPDEAKQAAPDPAPAPRHGSD
ncbi:MAG TPA: hypothetical protein ENK80_06220 [Rhodobacterales bacterium]|nr:hypothetical protein [Rhodobacterales bacterium]